MKLQVLITAVALAAAGAAFAQAPTATDKPAGDAAAATSTEMASEKMHKEAAKEKKHAGKMDAKRSGHAGKMDARHSARNSTRHMGAASSPPTTELDAQSRQQRMDDAYATWRSRQ
jgi:hypothetical protein